MFLGIMIIFFNVKNFIERKLRERRCRQMNRSLQQYASVSDIRGIAAQEVQKALHEKERVEYVERFECDSCLLWDRNMDEILFHKVFLKHSRITYMSLLKGIKYQNTQKIPFTTLCQYFCKVADNISKTDSNDRKTIEKILKFSIPTEKKVVYRNHSRAGLCLLMDFIVCRHEENFNRDALLSDIERYLNIPSSKESSPEIYLGHVHPDININAFQIDS